MGTVCDTLLAMTIESDMTGIETIFMALADQTRLRILNLIRDGEVCVVDFTEVLGVSQPKISRHLAYLRNAGVVEARRDGKWMHYSIRWPEDRGARAVLASTLDWLASQPTPDADTQRFNLISRSPAVAAQPARRAIPPGAQRVSDAFTEGRSTQVVRNEEPAETDRRPNHNDLEEFLL